MGALVESFEDLGLVVVAEGIGIKDK